VTDTDDFTPLHVSVGCGNLETTNIFVERRAALSNAKKYGVNPYWMVDAQCGKLYVINYLTEIAANQRLTQFLSSQICKQHNNT
jgi:hypothetical protein